MNLKGTGVAIVTPFNEDLSIDYTSFADLINYIIGGGVDYLVFMGTTGESVTLNKQEKDDIIRFAVETVAGRVPIVVGIGGNNTNLVIEQIKEANLDDVNAILSVAPYYNKPNQSGLYQHYKMIAENTDKAIILYNVPGRTGVNIEAKTTLKLAKDCKNIVAVKEASGNFDQIMQIVKNKPEDFLVISGDDALTLPLIATGLDGVISVAANLFPNDFSDMVNLSLTGEIKKARKLHYKMIDTINLLFADGNPSGIKAALSIKGIVKNIVRPPVHIVNEQVFNNLQSVLEN